MGRHKLPPMPECSDKGTRRSTCLRFCLYFFFLFILIIIIILAIVIMKLKPSLPAFDFTEFDTVKFEVGPGSFLQTKFVLSMKVDNSKTGLRITLEKGSSIKMSYNNTTISAGTLPEFRQEPGTVMGYKVVMEGKNEVEGDDLKILKAKCKKSFAIPLVVMIEVPMAVEMKELTAKLDFNVACVLMVDHLDVEEQLNRLTSHTCNIPGF